MLSRKHSVYLYQHYIHVITKKTCKIVVISYLVCIGSESENMPTHAASHEFQIFASTAMIRSDAFCILFVHYAEVNQKGTQYVMF